MSDTRYNGWSNYPTWATALWLGNDEGSYNWTVELTNEASDVHKHAVYALCNKFNIRDEGWVYASLDNGYMFIGLGRG